MKPVYFILLCFFSHALRAQDDVVFKVSKRNNILIMPDRADLIQEANYVFYITNLPIERIRGIQVSFGPFSFNQAENGRDIELHLHVAPSSLTLGTVTVDIEGMKKPLKKTYRIVNSFNPYLYRNGGGNGNLVTLLLDRDTLLNKGVVHQASLHKADSLCFNVINPDSGRMEHKLSNCIFSLLHDGHKIASYRVHGKFPFEAKSDLQHAKPGDTIVIEQFAWADGRSSKRMALLAYRYYEVMVTE